MVQTRAAKALAEATAAAASKSPTAGSPVESTSSAQAQLPVDKGKGKEQQWLAVDLTTEATNERARLSQKLNDILMEIDINDVAKPVYALLQVIDLKHFEHIIKVLTLSDKENAQADLSNWERAEMQVSKLWAQSTERTAAAASKPSTAGPPESITSPEQSQVAMDKGKGREQQWLAVNATKDATNERARLLYKLNELLVKDDIYDVSKPIYALLQVVGLEQFDYLVGYLARSDKETIQSTLDNWEHAVMRVVKHWAQKEKSGSAYNNIENRVISERPSMVDPQPEKASPYLRPTVASPSLVQEVDAAVSSPTPGSAGPSIQSGGESSKRGASLGTMPPPPKRARVMSQTPETQAEPYPPNTPGSGMTGRHSERIKSHGTPRSGTAKDTTLARDKNKCVVTLHGTAEVCHILPYSLLGRHELEEKGERADYWRSLNMILGQDWKEKVSTVIGFSLHRHDARYSGLETPANLITLDLMLHKMWASGLLAFRPEQRTSAKELILTFFWMSRLPGARFKLTDQPMAHEFAAWRSSKNDSLIRTQSKPEDCRPVSSGHQFTLTTDDGATLPLPSFDLMQLQWALTRLQGMIGGAGIQAYKFWRDYCDDDGMDPEKRSKVEEEVRRRNDWMFQKSEDQLERERDEASGAFDATWEPSCLQHNNSTILISNVNLWLSSIVP